MRVLIINYYIILRAVGELLPCLKGVNLKTICLQNTHFLGRKTTKLFINSFMSNCSVRIIVFTAGK